MTAKGATEDRLKEEKYNVLREFASIYGIGPETAQKLYNHKCRTLDDVRNFYGDPENALQQEDSEDGDSEDEDDEYEDKTKRVHESWIGVSLSLKDDLSIR